MEETPILISLDPDVKTEEEQIQEKLRRSRIFQRPNSMIMKKKLSLQKYDLDDNHAKSFKFKNIEDWKSIFTPF
jgi:hypothetical protein